MSANDSAMGGVSDEKDERVGTDGRRRKMIPECTTGENEKK